MDRFLEHLKELQPESVCLVDLSGGNHGDTLILMGITKKLKELKIDFDTSKRRLQEFSTMKLRKDSYLDYGLTIIRGGGYINDVWAIGRRFLSEVCRKSNRVIVSPSSYWAISGGKLEKTLQKIETPLVLYAREKYSYKWLDGMTKPKNIQIELAPDSAFYLTKDDLSKGEGSNEPLICFRDDVESTINKEILIELIRQNPSALIEDIPNVGSLNDFLTKISEASCIYTDHLHVAIIGAILDKKVFLYPNSYWKNIGVYEYSLSSFVNVKFVRGDFNGI